MKGKILILILVILAVAALFYQNNRLLETSRKLREVDEWVERKKIEDAIAKEMEGKRRNQEFIMQMDYQVQLQDMLGSKLTGVEEQIVQVKSAAESLVDSRISQLQENVVDLNRQKDEQLKELRLALDRQKQRLDELEAGFRQDLRSNEEAQRKYAEQIKYLKNQIQNLRKSQARLAAKLNANTPAP